MVEGDLGFETAETVLKMVAGDLGFETAERLKWLMRVLGLGVLGLRVKGLKNG